MKSTGASESHCNNTLKTAMAFARYIGPDLSFYDIRTKEKIVGFLDTKIKDNDNDPDKRWITTWNDYLGDLKYLFRWLHNYVLKLDHGIEPNSYPSDWETPPFAQIRKKKTKRLSPYGENEIWELDELQIIIKYEPHKRNKAALALMWDLGGRNHEIVLLKMRHIRLRERYGEGEVPHEAKTGSGPILLTCSFPYVRDWLNEHPFRNQPDSRLICNLMTGAPIKAEALWTMMKCLR
jgi:integrase/recombinase XerD